MVGLVIVSHSEKLADGIKELALEMAEDVLVEAVGGTNDGRIGSDINKIIDAVNKVYSEDGVLILYDLGSAKMNAEMALDFIEDSFRENIKVSNAALVEGAITAAAQISIGKSLNEVINSLHSLIIK